MKKTNYDLNIKPKTHWMYQELYDCICQNVNQFKIYNPLCQPYSPTVFQKSISKKTNIQEANDWSTTPTAARTISCKAWITPAEHPSWVTRCDIKGSDGTILNSIFWKKVQGQKTSNGWEIALRQITGVEMLFETNTKGHKYPIIRVFVIKQDTIGKPKKTECGIQHRYHAPPKTVLYNVWWGAASPILNDTFCVCIYTSYNRTRINNARI